MSAGPVVCSSAVAFGRLPSIAACFLSVRKSDSFGEAIVTHLDLGTIRTIGPCTWDLDFYPRFVDGQPSVVIRIGFIVCTKVRDALYDNLWVVATREGTFRVSPIAFGLASMTRRPMTPLTVTKMPRRFR